MTNILWQEIFNETKKMAVYRLDDHLDNTFLKIFIVTFHDICATIFLMIITCGIVNRVA